jgi:AraC family transcriptional regulator
VPPNRLTPERFEDGRAMLLGGSRRRHAFSAAEKGIAEQWRDFSSRQIPTRVGSLFYGVMCGSARWVGVVERSGK